jgi:hypothetical protein
MNVFDGTPKTRIAEAKIFSDARRPSSLGGATCARACNDRHVRMVCSDRRGAFSVSRLVV